VRGHKLANLYSYEPGKRYRITVPMRYGRPKNCRHCHGTGQLGVFTDGKSGTKFNAFCPCATVECISDEGTEAKNG